MPEREPRCPYCVDGETFHPMTIVAKGRIICKNCGHIAFPGDTAFRCPCAKCLQLDSSPRIRRLRQR